MKNRLSLAALCWMILAATSFAQTDRDLTTVARRQSIDWFKSANVGGPEGKMVPGVSESLFGIFDEGRQAIVLMPADLSKDGKPYYGLTWAGLFHTFEVTAEQASILEMTDGVTTMSGGRRDDLRRSEPLGQLDRLVVDNRDGLTGAERITGSVVCRLFDEPAGKLVLRIAYKRSGSTVVVTQPVRTIPADGVLKFNVDAVNDESDEKHHAGALPLFVDLCLDPGDDSDRKVVVLSNTLGTLLNIGGGGETTSKVAALEGTTWQWTGSDSTAKFLPGGNMEYNDSAFGGKWTQTGNSLKFDSNGFTLFEVVIEGNKMTGTWRRLQGDDTTSTVGTELKRIEP